MEEKKNERTVEKLDTGSYRIKDLLVNELTKDELVGIIISLEAQKTTISGQLREVRNRMIPGFERKLENLEGQLKLLKESAEEPYEEAQNKIKEAKAKAGEKKGMAKMA